MLKAILILIIFARAFNLSGQNLLANSGLNDRNTCTEFNALCAPEAWFFIPDYVVRPLQKESGDYYEVLAMGNSSRLSAASRNYIYTKLLCRLKTARQYRFSIWVNTANNHFDHLNIWFGNIEPNQRRQSVYIADPAFTISPAQEDSSKIKWKKYSYLYTAKGGEQFLMLGNLSQEGMDQSKITEVSKRGSVLYAIDDITLTPVDSTEKVCAEYSAVLKQVYDQNRRHPAGLIEDIKMDSSLINKEMTARKKEIVWVIVDTPPVLQKTLNDTLTVPDVLFLYNSSKLNLAFIKDLDAITQKLQGRKFKGLEITGHTDNKGTAAYNLQLSKDRAKAIKAYLITKLQLAPNDITLKAVGETNPVAGNETAEGRQRNRRVEIVVKH